MKCQQYLFYFLFYSVISFSLLSAINVTLCSDAWSVNPALDNIVDLQTDDSKKTIINGIFFHTAEESVQPALKIEVERLSNYSISSLANNQYELKIQNAKLAGDHLKYEQFPPDTFVGFLSVMAQEKDGNVTIRIATDKKTQLTPYFARGALWVRSKTSESHSPHHTSHQFAGPARP